MSPVTLVALPAWETRLLRGIAAASTIAVGIGVALAIAAEDRNDPRIAPALACLAIGGAVLVAIVAVTLRWTTSVRFDADAVVASCVLLPPRRVDRAAVARAVLGVVHSPSRYGLVPARRLALLDERGRAMLRATWSERALRLGPSNARTQDALVALARADVPVDVVPDATTPRELEVRHPGSTTWVDRHPHAAGALGFAIAAALGLTVAFVV